MREHYDEAALRRARGLYRAVRAWAKERGEVSVIGGWLVYEHVDPGHAQRSRDVDIALHSEDALQDAMRHLPGWGLVLRRKGRSTFPDAHFKDEHPLVFRLDLLPWGRTRRGSGSSGATASSISPAARP